MMRIKITNLSLRRLVFVWLVLMFSPIHGQATDLNKCIVSDPTGTPLNVRSFPQGEIINRLKNGREVYIQSEDSDSNGKNWASVSGYYKGNWRDWGWVFRPYLNCSNKSLDISAGESTGDLTSAIVFDRGVGMRELGIALPVHGNSQVRAFPNRCYYYGDGGYNISISDEFLDRYLKQGFSLNSLCLGLQSTMKFHPETGERLPTYIVADLDALRRNQVDCCLLTDELPLEIPQCFSRGLPLRDCTMKFNMDTGQKLNLVQRKKIKASSMAVHAAVNSRLSRGQFSGKCSCEDEQEYNDQCRAETHSSCSGPYIHGNLAVELNFITTAEFGYVSFIDVSGSFPLGYGYALTADGAAAPSASVESEKIAMASKNHSNKAKLRALKELLARN